MSSLVLSDVAYAFPDHTPLFTGLDLTVGPGLTALIGRNGVGKSTLLRLAAAELRPSAGSITVDGEPARPPAVAYLPQLLADAPAGRTLADLALGRDTDLTHLPWVDRRIRTWEPEPLRWLGVRAMYALYRTADRREATLPTTSRLAQLGNRLTGR